MAKPIKSVELCYSMIQFLIKIVIQSLLLSVYLLYAKINFRSKHFFLVILLNSLRLIFIIINKDKKNEKSVCAQIYFKVQHK